MEKVNPGKKTNHSDKAQVSEAAAQLLKETKKLANEFYENGLHKADDVQKSAKDTSDQLAEKVKKNPVTSVLIAAGVGFVLSSFLRK